MPTKGETKLPILNLGVSVPSSANLPSKSRTVFFFPSKFILPPLKSRAISFVSTTSNGPIRATTKLYEEKSFEMNELHAQLLMRR